jgi:hypothetical protein
VPSEEHAQAYEPKQSLTHFSSLFYQEFYADKGFEDGELVYRNKLVWFLHDCVLT